MPNWIWTIVTRCIAKDILIHHIGSWHHFKGSGDVVVLCDVTGTKGTSGVSNDARGLICLLIRLVGFIWIFRSVDWLWVVAEHIWTSWHSTQEVAPHGFHVKLICVIVIFSYWELLCSWHCTYARLRALVLHCPSTLISVPSIQLLLKIPC